MALRIVEPDMVSVQSIVVVAVLHATSHIHCPTGSVTAEIYPVLDSSDSIEPTLRLTPKGSAR
jgi:hypothetical protein